MTDRIQELNRLLMANSAEIVLMDKTTQELRTARESMELELKSLIDEEANQLLIYTTQPDGSPGEADYRYNYGVVEFRSLIGRWTESVGKVVAILNGGVIILTRDNIGNNGTKLYPRIYKEES